MNRFYFNNNYNDDFNIIITSKIDIPFTDEEIEDIKVDGMSGTLTIKKGTYENKQIKINLFLIEKNNIFEKIEAIDNWLSNIKDNRLIINNRDKSYIVKRVLKSSLTRDLIAGASTTVTFICEPFLRLIDEKEVELIGNNIFYLGNIPSECKIRLYGSGTVQLELNGELLQIKNLQNYCDIDTKYMQVKNPDGSNKNLDFIGNFPMLIPGQNTFIKTGTITKIVIDPRTVFRN